MNLEILRFTLVVASLGVEILIAQGCAGPSTPLGAVWALTPEQAMKSEEMAQAKRVSSDAKDEIVRQELTPKISFSPSKQVLHGKSPMTVIIDDIAGDFSDYHLIVHYDGLDVSKTFLRRARVSYDYISRRIRIASPSIRLSPAVDHKIEVAYRSSRGAFAYARYEPPSCYAFRVSRVTTLGDFSPSLSMIKLIEKLSLDQGVNPAFITALIAQESAFNPRAVSWARAVGLTQITPSAESEVIQTNLDWPRYPGLKRIPVPLLKAMVLAGRINRRNEWRLDRGRSIRGGIEYAIILSRRWSTPENLTRIRALFPDPEQAHTRLILASYQSGYSRVYSALERDGRGWLEDDDLTEARKYVNRIFSFCSYFSESEAKLENAS